MNPITFAAQGLAKSSGNNNTVGYNNNVLPHHHSVKSFPPREQCRVLNLGCGNSSFTENMQRDGWVGPIVNVDFSSVVIEQMKERYNDEYYEALKSRVPVSKMTFLCADITKHLPFEDESFDLIICKGAFDAVLCSPAARAEALNLVRECVRLLARGHGIFFLVTHGNPDSRIEYLEHEFSLGHYWFGVNIHQSKRAPPHSPEHAKSDYVYVCRKNFYVPTTEEDLEKLVSTAVSLDSARTIEEEGKEDEAAAQKENVVSM